MAESTFDLLITGASGLLGANAVHVATAKGLKVVAIHHRHETRFPNARNRSVDLADFEAVKRLMRECRPAWTMHCAAATQVDWCETHLEETWAANVLSTRQLAKCASEIGSRFLYVSTDSVFDGERGAYAESDETNPINVYAKSKRAGEDAARETIEDALIVRTNLYGWNVQPKRSLAEWILDQLLRENQITGFDDVVFSPLLANDLAEASLQLMKTNAEGIYHLGSKEPCSKYEFALLLAKVFELDASPIARGSMRDATFVATRPLNTSLSSEKAALRLSMSLPTVEEGLRRFRALRESGYADSLRTYYLSHSGAVS